MPDSLTSTQQADPMGALWEAAAGRVDFDPANAVVAGLLEGRSLAQIQGLSREDLDVLYTYGFNFLNAGSFEQAVVVFSQLTLIDPLESRHAYCLGVCFQSMGQHQRACDAFVAFLALDPVNPAGYLRLGECFAAQGDHEGAREAYGLARAEADKGNGSEAIRDETYRRLAQLTQGAAT